MKRCWAPRCGLRRLTGAVEITVPPNASSGRVMRLRGKGLPGAGENAAGDLFLTLRIVLPAAEDEALTELMREWRDHKPYDPRAGFGG